MRLSTGERNFGCETRGYRMTNDRDNFKATRQRQQPGRTERNWTNDRMSSRSFGIAFYSGNKSSESPTGCVSGARASRRTPPAREWAATRLRSGRIFGSTGDRPIGQTINRPHRKSRGLSPTRSPASTQSPRTTVTGVKNDKSFAV